MMMFLLEGSKKVLQKCRRSESASGGDTHAQRTLLCLHSIFRTLVVAALLFSVA